MMFGNWLNIAFYNDNSRQSFGPKIDAEVFIVTMKTTASFIGVMTFFWTILLDKYKFKITYSIILCLCIYNAFVVPGVIENMDDGAVIFKKIIYFIGEIFIVLCISGQNMVFVLALVNTYGAEGGMKAYTIGTTYTMLVGLTLIAYSKAVYEEQILTFQQTEFIWGSMSVLSMILLHIVYKGTATK